MKTLKLVENKEFNAAIPASKKNAVKVSDLKSAKRLLSRPISELQKGDIENATAKDLTYLLNVFVQISKQVDQEAEIKQAIEIKFMYLQRMVRESLDILRDELYQIVGEDKIDILSEKLLTTNRKLDQKIPQIRMQLKEDLNNQFSLDIGDIKKKNLNIEYRVESLKLVIANLPKDVRIKLLNELYSQYG